MIFQEPMTALNPVLTVGRQIGENLKAHTALGRRARTERAVELFDQVGIPAAAEQPADTPTGLNPLAGRRNRRDQHTRDAITG